MSNELRVSFAGCIWLSYRAHAATLHPCAFAMLQGGVTRDDYFLFRLAAWSVHGASAFCYPEENCYNIP